jgi:cysteinyl-tRNA synthetase
VVIVSKDKAVADAVKVLGDTLKGVCNAKNVFVSPTEKLEGEFAAAESTVGKILVKTSMDEGLLDEALFRELVREVQDMRKKGKFQIKDKIRLSLKSDEKTSRFLERKKKELAREVGAAKLKIGELAGEHKDKMKFKNVEVEIAFSKS